MQALKIESSGKVQGRPWNLRNSLKITTICRSFNLIPVIAVHTIKNILEGKFG